MDEGRSGGTLEGRVVIITGAGRGLGREHALLFATEGAKVVVNDVGSTADGPGAAEAVVEEIRDSGGDAVSNADSVSDWEGAERLVNTAIEAFGDLHVVVNNAGIIRDRMLFNMSEVEFDAVVDVHLKGTFCPSRWAAAYWREQAKAGRKLSAAIVNTSSTAGLHGNWGQSNYAAAKAGVAAMTLVHAKELARYGVRVNAISPVARTLLSEATPGLGELVQAPEGQDFDSWHPGNVSPLVGYLATEECPFTGNVFCVHGGSIGQYQGWSIHKELTTDGRWTIAELAHAARSLEGTVPVREPSFLSQLPLQSTETPIVTDS